MSAPDYPEHVSGSDELHVDTPGRDSCTFARCYALSIGAVRMESPTFDPHSKHNIVSFRQLCLTELGQRCDKHSLSRYVVVTAHSKHADSYSSSCHCDMC